METEEIKKVPKKKVKYTSDWTLWACYIILCAVSVVEVFSASSLELKNGSVYLPIASHVRWLGIGFLLVFGFEHLHYKFTKIFMLFVVAISVLLAVLTPFVGESVNGAVRAINFGFISVQAAEPCKLASAMLLAYVLSRLQKPDGTGLSVKGVWWGIGLIMLFVALLVTQGGSNAILVFVVGVTLMILSVLPQKLINIGVIVVVLGIAGLATVYIIDNNKQEPELTEQTIEDKKDKSQKGVTSKFRVGTWENRINDYLSDLFDPEPYKKPTSYAVGGNSQKHHAFMAIAHGNGVGVMPGNSRECSRLQLAFSDYIYAIIIEELGLFGGIIVLLCYLGIIIRACMISQKCKSAYASLLIMGMALVIVYQAFYHMSISLGLLPVSGQTLPFISKGGTSILVMSIAMGIMLSVSRFAVERTDSGLKTIDDDDELPDDLKADNPAAGF